MPDKIHFVTNVEKGFPDSVNGYSVNFSDSTPKYGRFPIDLSGNIIYIIDIHFLFEERHKSQEYQGLNFYKMLLSEFSECQENLKVIFYSPLSVKFITGQKLENYILNELPFVQMDENGDFEERLVKEIELRNNNSWPVFNSASLNLISGWALSGFKKVSTNYTFEKPWVCIVDDQMTQWKRAYELIFDDIIHLKLHQYKRTKEDNAYSYKKIQGNKERLKRANLIISDFYLEENHEPANWLNQEELSTKSGFQFYKEIVGTKNKPGRNSGVPFMVHSSSNKVPYFKFLQAHGIDDWCVKDVNIYTTANNQLNYFLLFKSQVEHYISCENYNNYENFQEMWNSVINLQNPKRLKDLWWESDAELVIREFKNACYDVKNFLSQQRFYVEEMGIDNESYIAASIISNLYKLVEWWRNIKKFKVNFLFRVLSQLRNEAAHHNVKRLSIEDAMLYLRILISLFETNLIKQPSILFNPRIGSKNYPDYFIGSFKEKSDKDSAKRFKNGPLLFYCQLYNSKALENYKIEEEQKLKINEMLLSLIKNKLSHLNKTEINDLVNDIREHKPPIKAPRSITKELKLSQLIAFELENGELVAEIINERILIRNIE